MSQTRIGNVRNSTGQAFSGAIAAADTAPATNAIARRRQPDDRTILWAKLASSAGCAAGWRRGGRYRRAGARASLAARAPALWHRELSANDDPYADIFCPVCPAEDQHRALPPQTAPGRAPTRRGPEHG